jgi:hypothetical protein
MAIVFPVQPNKKEEARTLAHELLGPRREAQMSSFRRMGVTREHWYLQSTPVGDMIIVWLESPDPTNSLRIWSASRDPHDVWFKERAGAISGLDYNQLPPTFPEQIFEWHAD